ncbi:MAG: hypothetical protein R2932_37840 [Caldilineaceae bacterium]
MGNHWRFRYDLPDATIQHLTASVRPSLADGFDASAPTVGCDPSGAGSPSPVAERISGAGLLATISSTVTVWPRAMAVAHKSAGQAFCDFRRQPRRLLLEEVPSCRLGAYITKYSDRQCLALKRTGLIG